MQSSVASGVHIMLAIFDRGIWPPHVTTLEATRLLLGRAWNVVDGNANVTDPVTGGMLNNPGHGTATLALLAGGRIDVRSSALGGFHGNFGGSPFRSVVPFRIADSVVHFYTSAMAEGIAKVNDTAVAEPAVDLVCSVSMGGVASQSWADAVYAAYDAGVKIVAAAGNNHGGFPTSYVACPSRFNRVVTAVGATSEHMPYLHSDPTVMQGCVGPASAMRRSVAGYTPQAP